MTEHKTNIKKQVNRRIGKAIHQYDLISHGDRILVGVSGGKDSMTLLKSLLELRGRAPIDFSVIPVHVDPGFDTSFSQELYAYCSNLGVDLLIENTNFRKTELFRKNLKNPCFVCAKLRRKRFFDLAEKHQCCKVALGHNKDDLIETFFINMMYAGQISTMLPKQDFFKGNLEIIRPLAFLSEKRILNFIETEGIRVFENPCPFVKTSKRSEVRILLNDLFKKDKNIRGNIFRAMRNVRMDYMLK